MLKDFIISIYEHLCDKQVETFADAGYTFDFEKKELKKIEHSNTDEYIETKGLFEIEAEAEELTKQKPAWSEEDNLQLQAAIDICKSSGHTITSDWLKSLKDKIQL